MEFRTGAVSSGDDVTTAEPSASSRIDGGLLSEGSRPVSTSFSVDRALEGEKEEFW